MLTGGSAGTSDLWGRNGVAAGIEDPAVRLRARPPLGTVPSPMSKVQLRFKVMLPSGIQRRGP
jgi:hypothetical protein